MSQKRNGFKVMGGWRVGVPPEKSVTKSGLLVPVGTRDGNDALTLIDVSTGQRFWAEPTGAWRFIWPPTGKPVIAVRESQINAEEELDHVDSEGQYLGPRDRSRGADNRKPPPPPGVSVGRT